MVLKRPLQGPMAHLGVGPQKLALGQPGRAFAFEMEAADLKLGDLRLEIRDEAHEVDGLLAQGVERIGLLAALGVDVLETPELVVDVLTKELPKVHGPRAGVGRMKEGLLVLLELLVDRGELRVERAHEVLAAIALVLANAEATFERRAILSERVDGALDWGQSTLE